MTPSSKVTSFEDQRHRRHVNGDHPFGVIRLKIQDGLWLKDNTTEDHYAELCYSEPHFESDANFDIRNQGAKGSSFYNVFLRM